MRKAFAALAVVSAFVSTAAFAHTSVQGMSCKQAQDFVAKHGYYWKEVSRDDMVRIYPVYTLEKVHCVGKVYTMAQVEKTKDDHSCVVGYYCMAY